MIIVLLRGNKPHENSSYNIIILEQNRLIPLKKERNEEESKVKSVEVRFCFVFSLFYISTIFFFLHTFNIKITATRRESNCVRKTGQGSKKEHDASYCRNNQGPEHYELMSII